MVFEERKLGEICTYSRGLTYKKSDEAEYSSNAVLRANNISLESGELNFDEIRYLKDSIEIPESKMIRGGSLLVCTASGSKKHLGKIAYIESDLDYAFGGFMGLITPVEGVNARYLYWLTRSDICREFIAALSDGANINNLKFSQLSEFNVPIPPLPEQQRIVAILDEAFAGIASAVESAEKNLVNAKELYRSHVAEMFKDLGTTWSYQPLKDVSENLDSFRKPITKHDRVAGDIPYYGASGIVDHVADFIFDEDLLAVSEDGANLLARTYPIAFPIYGKSWVNNHAHVLRFQSDSQQKVIEHYLNSIDLAPYVSGMAQPKLNQRSLNSIRVPWTEEQRFADQLSNGIEYIRSKTQSLELIYEQKLDTLAELKQSILQKAFSGELTAEPDKALAGAGL